MKAKFSPQTFIIKILHTIQFGVACSGTILTPSDQCIYGFFAFAIGCTHALLHLMISEKSHQHIDKENLADQPEIVKRNIILIAIESIHDYLPLGFINMEFYRLSSQYPLVSFVFCIPFSLDILSHLFDDHKQHVADEKVLLYLKRFNIIIHSISIVALAKRELNIWFMCVWLTTLIVSVGLAYESSSFYMGKCMKLIGYIFFYTFTLIGITDDDFLRHLEWFNMNTMDYQ